MARNNLEERSLLESAFENLLMILNGILLIKVYFYGMEY